MGRYQDIIEKAGMHLQPLQTPGEREKKTGNRKRNQKIERKKRRDV